VPGSAREIGNDERHHDGEHAAVTPSRIWTTTTHDGFVTVANRRPRIGKAAKPTISNGRRPQSCARIPTHGDMAATTNCGTTTGRFAAAAEGRLRLSLTGTRPSPSGGLRSISRGAIYRVKSPIKSVHKAEFSRAWAAMQEIADWLTRLGLPEYAGAFAENGIDVSDRLPPRPS
jgi:hypothetical protein